MGAARRLPSPPTEDPGEPQAFDELGVDAPLKLRRLGILRVVGQDGSFATAPIQHDGTFTLTDVSPGEVKVGVMEAPQSSSSSDAKPGAPGQTARRAAPLPAKVADPETSGLTYTITSNTRDLTIEIN